MSRRFRKKKNRDIDDRCLEVADYFIDNKSTVRATSEHFNLSKSTVHLDLTVRLEQVDPSRYSAVRELLDYNTSQRHIRGGLATRKKYIILSNKSTKEND